MVRASYFQRSDKGAAAAQILRYAFSFIAAVPTSIRTKLVGERSAKGVERLIARSNVAIINDDEPVVECACLRHPYL